MSQSEIKLEGVVNIAKAEALHQQMEALVIGGAPVSIDASEVTRVDTSIVQLLASFLDALKRTGIEVSWSGVSDEFRDGIKLLGMEQAITF